MEWFLSGLEEGNEEVVQKFINNSVSKVLYDGSTELLNPKEAIKDYAMGTLVGWGLGGSQIGAKKAVDTINRVDQEHKDIKLREKEQEAIDTTDDDTSVKQEWYGNKLTQNKNNAEKREGYNNYIDPDRFIEGLWDDGKSSIKNADAENVEKSQLESVENVDGNGIISYSEKPQDIFDIDSLPEQMHHFATNKNKKYTPLFNEIVSRYGLDLDGDWNMENMKHRGKHPYIYHDYILFKIKKCDMTANGDVDIFKNEFEIVKKKIMDNPLMLRKAFWKGKTMKYYLMMYNFAQADRQKHIGSLKTINNTMPRYSVCSGKYVENWNPNITLICDDKNEKIVPDRLCEINGWVVVSQRFIDTVKPFDDGAIQYLPIKVDAIQPQMQGEKYYVANVIRVLDVYDYEKGDWDYMGPNKEYRDPITYVLKKDEIKNNHIFIIKDDLLSQLIVVSEELKNAIVKAKLLGFGFLEVEVV